MPLEIGSEDTAGSEYLKKPGHMLTINQALLFQISLAPVIFLRFFLIHLCRIDVSKF